MVQAPSVATATVEATGMVEATEMVATKMKAHITQELATEVFGLRQNRLAMVTRNSLSA